MAAELISLMIAIVAGAALQVGVGVGFSIVVAPLMMVMLGTATAVPVLLLLNTLVSAAALDMRVWAGERKLISTAIWSCLVGIVLGSLVYPFLTERVVLSLTAILLLIGVVSTFAPLKSNFGMTGYRAVSGVSGLATIWAATPGPLMMFGLLAIGRPAREARKLVQPIALVAYCVAFVLHLVIGTPEFFDNSDLPKFLAAAIIGSILGRLVGPRLPQNAITIAIRVVSVAACIVLFRRAYLAG